MAILEVLELGGFRRRARADHPVEGILGGRGRGVGIIEGSGTIETADRREGAF